MKGFLILENGLVFEGLSFGSEREVSGEIVFSTGMVGYPESFTDPSYHGQILTLTYPLIGNYGVPAKTNFESEKIQLRGLIVNSFIKENSHWQAKKDLGSWLRQEKIPALAGIDTRTLTQIFVKSGVMKSLITFNKPRQTAGFKFYDINKENLVAQVSCPKPLVYGRGKTRVLLIDCGLKLSILKELLKHDLTVIRVPWDFDPFDNPCQFDAVVVSNGPGDPKMAKQTVTTVREVIKRKIPILGICLGNQILALALGANTYKLKYGHRGQNQPVKNSHSSKCFVTTQNHSFAVDEKTLPSGCQAWFTNLNDGTNEGIRHTRLPFFGIQFHPEAAPGPTDTEWIFEYFLAQVKTWHQKN